MLLVLAALRFEAAPLRRLLRRRGLAAAVAVTGIGPRAAGTRARLLIARHRPRAVLGVGFCGALQPGWPVGTVVRPRCLQSEDGGPVLEVGCWAMPEVAGTLLSVRRAATTTHCKRALAQRFAAQWVDQESYAWAAAARAAAVPCVIVRVVVDAAGDTLPDWRRPETWGAWWRLPQRALRARGSLTTAAAQAAARLQPAAAAGETSRRW